MPIVKKIYQNFIRQYGKKEGESRYFAWEKANPDKYKKGLATARRKGDTIIKHAPKSKTMKKKSRIDNLKPKGKTALQRFINSRQGSKKKKRS